MVKKPAYTELKERIKELEKKNTELKQVEEALKTAKEFAENLLETANTIVVTLDNAGLALYGLSPMSPARGNIREIEKASKRAELSKQMLAYSGKGPAGFIQKPYNMAVLQEKLIEVLPAEGDE